MVGLYSPLNGSFDPTVRNVNVVENTVVRRSSVSADGAGTFWFVGGPKVATLYGTVSYGEQRVPPPYAAIMRWGNYNFAEGKFHPSGDWFVDASGYSTD
jgi:hypothetical protein